MKFVAEDERLFIEFQGTEKVLGFQSKLDIPVSCIVNLEWRPEFRISPPIRRMVGTGLPGILYAGRFRVGKEPYFLYLLRARGRRWFTGPIEAQNVLVISTQDYPFKCITLTCRPDIGASLLNWWKRVK